MHHGFYYCILNDNWEPLKYSEETNRLTVVADITQATFWTTHQEVLKMIDSNSHLGWLHVGHVHIEVEMLEG